MYILSTNIKFLVEYTEILNVQTQTVFFLSLPLNLLQTKMQSFTVI